MLLQVKQNNKKFTSKFKYIYIYIRRLKTYLEVQKEYSKYITHKSKMEFWFENVSTSYICLYAGMCSSTNI